MSSSTTIEEFTLKRVEATALDGARKAAAVAPSAVPEPRVAPTARRHGISTVEGVEAFSSILDRCTFPQIVVRAAAGDVPEPSSPSAERGEAAESPAAASHERPDLKTRYEAPRNKIEQALAQIWQQALGFERIGIYDNFFQLGGHSVVAIQLISRIREEFEISSPSTFSSKPTPSPTWRPSSCVR